MSPTPYFILLALYAGFVGTVVAVNVAVLSLLALFQWFWAWQRRRSDSALDAPTGAVANAS